MTRPDLSVVLPTYNGADHLGAQLTALAAQDPDPPWELIVVDNGSTDGTLDVVRAYAPALPSLRLLTVDAPRGKPFALNAGVAVARAEHLAFLDQDDEIWPGYLAAIARALYVHELAWGRVDFVRLNPPWLVEALSRWPEPAHLSITLGADDVPVAFGCCLAVRRTALLGAGGFATDVGVCDDSELCLRLWRRGTGLAAVDDAVVSYRLRARAGALFRQRYGYGSSWVRLYGRYRALGMPRPGPRSTLGGLLTAGRWLASPSRAVRTRGVASLAFTLGRLRESARQRVWYV